GRADMHGQIAEAGRAWAETELPAGLEPFLGYPGGQHQDPFLLADKEIAHHQDPFRRGPYMVSVSHATALGVRVDGFGPLSGRRGQVRGGADKLEASGISGAQQHLGHMQGEISVYAGMDHVLEKGPLEK